MSCNLVHMSGEFFNTHVSKIVKIGADGEEIFASLYQKMWMSVCMYVCMYGRMDVCVHFIRTF